MTVEWPGMSVLSSNHITPLNEQTKKYLQANNSQPFYPVPVCWSLAQQCEVRWPVGGEKSQIFIDIEFIRILFLFLNILLEKEILR